MNEKKTRYKYIDGEIDEYMLGMGARGGGFISNFSGEGMHGDPGYI